MAKENGEVRGEGALHRGFRFFLALEKGHQIIAEKGLRPLSFEEAQE